MNLVFDVLHADSLQFSVPRSPLAEGRTHPTMDQSIRAVCESIGIELIEYDIARRFVVAQTDAVNITLMGKLCVRKLTDAR